MDIITQLSAVGYLGKRLQLLGQEIQGLGYTLSSTDANMRSPTGLNMTPDDFHHLAGTAARLQAQIEHTLDEAKRLMFAAELVLDGLESDLFPERFKDLKLLPPR